MYYISNMKSLQERLIWLRTERQLSQAELAEKVGVSQSAIAHLESGYRKTSRYIFTIADVLKVSADWLANGIGAPDEVKAAELQRTEPSSMTAAELKILIDLYSQSNATGREFIVKAARSAAQKAK